MRLIKFTSAFEARIRFTYVNEDSKEKRTNRTIVFDAENFTDAEAKATTYCEQNSLQEFSVSPIRKSKVNYAILDDEDEGVFCSIKNRVSYLTESGKERFVTDMILVHCKSASEAIAKVESLFEYCSIIQVSKSKIFEVIEND